MLTCKIEFIDQSDVWQEMLQFDECDERKWALSHMYKGKVSPGQEALSGGPITD